MKAEPFVIERTVNAPVEKVWQAISDPKQMKEWYFDIPEFKAVVGTEFQFNGGPPGKVYVHLCKVLEVEVNRKLKYSWRYEGYEGNSFVTWELFSEGSKTRVKLTHEGLETFPPEEDFARTNFEAGWNMIVGQLLEDFLNKEN